MRSSVLRIIIPLAAIVFGAIVVFSVLKTSQPATTPGANDEAADQTITSDSDSGDGQAETQPPADLSADTADLQDAERRSGDDQPGEGPTIGPADADQPESEPAGDAIINDPTFAGLHLRPQPAAPLTPLGELDDPDDPDSLRLHFSQRGAGVSDIILRDHYADLEHTPENRFNLLAGAPAGRPALAIRALVINDSIRLEVYDENAADAAALWRELAPGEFVAEVVNERDEVVLTIHRRYVLGPTPDLITLEQEIRNESETPVSLRIEQWGPGDLPPDEGGYGDYRRVHFGYLDPRSSTQVLASDKDLRITRANILKDAFNRDYERWTQGLPPTIETHRLWPNETSQDKRYDLGWTATTNRYFGFAVFPYFEDVAAQADKSFDAVEEVLFYLESEGENRIAQIGYDQVTGRKNFAEVESRYMSLKLVSRSFELAPGEAVEFDMQAYGGGLERSLLAKQEPYRSLNLRELIVYELGCAWCTFQWLGHLLLQFLSVIEIVIRDWGLAIIILVLCVRALLHPLTKRAQVSMQRFQKKMSKLQPEMKKLQEKYKDNPKKLQQEQMRLYREHNVNPAGCLGMAPMFLQMPIWVALYAMLYFAIELRHEPAFYGVFQLFGNWRFLADLAQPDHFLYFGRPIFQNVPLLGSLPLIGSIDALNLLPILMGVVFYLQQKYMTPQNPNMSPEMETQQKIMKIIFPLIFPIMLYKAPSGLTLYIMTSSFIGILESKYIRAHIDQLDLEGEQPSKVSGWRKRIMDHAIEAANQRAAAKRGGGGATGRRYTTAPTQQKPRPRPKPKRR